MATVPDWEWVNTGRGGQKAIAFASVLPSSSTEYGGSVVSDNQTPEIWREFSTERAPESVVDEVEDLYNTRKGTMTIRGWTGYVTGYSANLAALGCEVWELKVTLTRPLINLSNGSVQG